MQVRFSTEGPRCPLPQDKTAARLPGCFQFDRNEQPFKPHSRPTPKPTPKPTPQPPRPKPNPTRDHDRTPPRVLPPRVPKNAKFDDLFEGQTPEETIAAEATRGAYIRYNMGLIEAQRFVEDNIPGYQIDTELTTPDALVLTKGIGSAPDDIIVAFRGTQSKEPIRDWTTNAARPVEIAWGGVGEWRG